jgi:hypothetical protein
MLFDVEGRGPQNIPVRALTVAGWTGRDRAKVDHHIAELAAIGVAPPSTVPVFYRASVATLTQADAIEALGDETSGEAEPLLVRWDGRLWLGLGSDHTDRGLEAHSVAHSKQICAKPVAGALWSLDALRDRLDGLVLRSWIEEGGAEVLYQDGTLAAIRPLAELEATNSLAEGEAMLCGTLGAIGGVRPAARFRMALIDEASGRRIEHAYRVTALPVRS